MDESMKLHPIDRGKVFLLGGSGGGHMALMMAAYAPKKFLGVSSWCPITDLAAWGRQNKDYAPHIEACCGGKPGFSPDTDKEYRERSPISHAAAVVGANLSVHHGRFDKSVPYSHTVNFALTLVKLSPVNFFFVILDGAHEIRHDAAFAWFDKLAGRETRTENELSR